jgi:hypothetical protein
MFEPNVLICVINKISTNLNSFSYFGNEWWTFDKQKRSLNLKMIFNDFFRKYFMRRVTFCLSVMNILSIIDFLGIFWNKTQHKAMLDV